MATITWSNTGGGNWGVGANWKGGVAPGSADTAVVNGTGTYTVTINAAYAAKYVNFDDANATLWMRGGNFALGSKLTLTAGTLHLDGTYGTAILSGGTLDLAGGVLDCTGGELNGVTVEGPLTINNPNPSSALLIGASGLTAVGAGGVGNGVINVTGSNSHLDFLAGGNLNNATVNLGAPSYGAYVQATGSLTLGAGLTVDQKYSLATLSATTTLTNDGTIAATAASNYASWIRMQAAYVLNAGVASVSTDSLFLSGASVANKGTISATSGGTVVFGGSAADTFTNTGGVTISSATADLSCTLTTASLNKFKNTSGSIIIGGVGSGYLVNSGATLSVGTATSLGLVTLAANGIIDGGSINLSGGQPVWNGGQLNGVTIDGALDLNAPNGSPASYLQIGASGAKFTGAGGSGAGTIAITGYTAQLLFQSAETLSSITASIGNSLYTQITYAGAVLRDQSALTLAASDSITMVNHRGSIVAGTSLVNAGAIAVNQTPAYFFSNNFAGSFVEAGTYLLNSGVITNTSSAVGVGLVAPTMVNKGTITASNHGILVLGGGVADTFTNSGVVSLTNATADISCALTTATLDTFKLSSSSVVIGSDALHAGGYWQQTGVLLNTGATLSVGSGTSLGYLTLVGGGTITGGTIAQTGLGLVTRGGELDGVIVEGVINVNYGQVNVSTNGITLKGAGGVGAGTINVPSGRLYFYGSQTLSNAVLTLGTPGNRGSVFAQGTLTLAVNDTIFQNNDQGVISAGTEVINDGTANATASANYNYLNFGGPTFVNNGLMQVSGNDQLQLNASTNVNSGTITATAGGEIVLGGGTFTNSGVVAANAGRIFVADTISAATLNGFTVSNGGRTTIGRFGTVNAAGATIAVGSTSNIGTLTLYNSGEIYGGTIVQTGYGLVSLGGELNGVTVEGALNVQSGGFASLSVGANGLTLTGAGGVGAGTLNLGGPHGDSLNFLANASLDNLVLNVGCPYGAASGISGAYGGSALTLGAGVTLNQNSYRLFLDFFTTLTNAGTINADAASPNIGQTYISIYSTTYFANSGVINIAGTDRIELRAGRSANSGTISIAGGTQGQLNVDSSTLTSTGLITLAGGGIGGGGSIVTSGTVSGFGVISDALTNTGAIIASGGTLNLAGGAVSGFAAGTLTGGIWQADAASVLQLPNNVAITTDKATLVLSGAGSVIESYNTISLAQITIDSTLKVIGASGALKLLAGRSWTTANTMTNSGQLILAGGTFTAPSLTNSGALQGSGTVDAKISGTGALIAVGGNLNLQGSTLANIVAGTLTGGGLIADASSTLQLANNAAVTALAGLAELNGVGSQIQSLAGSETTLEASLTSIAAAGTLEVLGGRNFAAANAIANAGKLQLGGGTFSGGALTDQTGATISGFGTVTSALTIQAGAQVNANGTTALVLSPVSHTLVNAGTVLASGVGGVTLSGVVDNTGSLQVKSAGSIASQIKIGTGGATLSGGGAVTLSGAASRIVGVSAPTTLTNVDNTISGVGAVGANNMTLINDAAGVIEATGLLTVRDAAGASVTNAGLIEANATGKLALVSETVNQAGGGTILAAGGLVTLQGVDFVGGTLTTTGAGRINVDGGGVTLDGGTSLVTVSGLVQVTGGQTLTVDGVITNSGKLDLHAARLFVAAAGATLSGGGQVNLNSSSANIIVGVSAGTTLTNVNDRIAGSGNLGDGLMTLVNQAGGQIIGNQAVALTIDTGTATVLNVGLIENSGAGGTLVKSAVANSGTLFAVTAGTLTLQGAVTGAGVAQINGGTLYVLQAFAENVTFTGSTGVLELGASQAYAGQVKGLSSAGTNSLDLVDIAFSNTKTKASYSGTTTSGVLTVTDGTHTAKIGLLGNYTTATFVVSSDGHGGTKVVDPSAPSAPTPLAHAIAAFAPAPASALVHGQDWRPAMPTLAHPQA